MIITIDGKECSCEQGEFVLDVARRNGIYIPTLCYHEGLESLGACRVCIVEVVQRGQSKVVVSCAYPLQEEIEVFTASDKILEQRGVILSLLANLAPGSQVIQQMAAHNGADMPRLTPKEEGDACILCGRCTSACELLGAGAIAKVSRGTSKAIDTPYGRPSEECIGCASCAYVCPTNAIPYTETEEQVSIWGKTFELKHCSVCDASMSPKEFIASATTATEDDDRLICASCKKKTVAKKIGTYSLK